ncbi:MAG: YkgJ family cysteine cluster protein [Gemmatimonadales bacterium]|nr:YkgJ family cysteine cluster protein [Gemmatimonadales bacterium]
MTEPPTGAAVYRHLLERLDAWHAEGRRRHPGIVPCGAGCSACCLGPFDISVADVELLREALDKMTQEERTEVERRAERLLRAMEDEAPDWTAPHAIADLGDERFDRLAEWLAREPCPLLADDGRCRIYPDRPLVCRLIGLPMTSPAGRAIENTCPIQERFPAYAALPAVPFDLEEFELTEMECLQAAARRLSVDSSRSDFETTIAAAVVDARRP